jgi:hypothetical protein
MRAVQESVAQMIQEGMDEATAQQQAMGLARQRTSGGSTKLVRSRAVGALGEPGGGLGGSSGGSTGYPNGGLV